MSNPYRDQPERAFWRQAVAERHVADLTELWTPMRLVPRDRVATAGSCFAQHIGRALVRRGARYLDMEPAPDVFADEQEARRFGYGVFSCRYGNIYTTRQLVQLIEESLGLRRPAEAVWEKAGRFFDALRPGITPVGEASPKDVLTERELHLAAVQKMLRTLDVFVFTMGLTEGWMSVADGTMYPTAPGTIAGTFDPARYRFHNLRYGEIREDMDRVVALLAEVNPSARILLTVSPVPLVATATDGHVLPATVYSKSVLRAVAGDLASDHAHVHYFPSYEIISAHPSRGFFFEPDLRNVNDSGVALVMDHFFSGAIGRAFGGARAVEAADEIDLICDEARNDPGF